MENALAREGHGVFVVEEQFERIENRLLDELDSFLDVVMGLIYMFKRVLLQALGK
jgi:hypothetical protein